MKQVNLIQEDQDAIDAIVATQQKERVSNISDEHHLTTALKPASLANVTQGIAIKGLEGIPSSMIALPYVRLIQPSSKNATMKDGKEAPFGSFLFGDTLEAYDELDFVMFGAKKEFKKIDMSGNFVAPDYQGEFKTKQQVSILGMTIGEEKVFILSLSPTSFTHWGQLMAQFVALQVDVSWRFPITVTATKTENEKGKYAVANFTIGKEITGEAFQVIEEKALRYGASLNREEIVEDIEE